MLNNHKQEENPNLNSSFGGAVGVDVPEQTEGRIQADCFQWFHNDFPALRGLMYHVPNGGLKGGKEAGQLKAMGVVAGVPDLEFHFWKRTFFLECKTPKGVVSKDQKRIHSILDEHGFRVFVFRSLKEFQEIVFAIIEDKSPTYKRGLKRSEFEYKNKVFTYIYNLEAGRVQVLAEIVDPENMERFKGLVIEFLNEGFDRLEGFEILFTPDYLGFYKKELENETEVFYNGSNNIKAE
jgi:acylphosphatase